MTDDIYTRTWLPKGILIDTRQGKWIQSSIPAKSASDQLEGKVRWQWAGPGRGEKGKEAEGGARGADRVVSQGSIKGARPMGESYITLTLLSGSAAASPSPEPHIQWAPSVSGARERERLVAPLLRSAVSRFCTYKHSLAVLLSCEVVFHKASTPHAASEPRFSSRLLDGWAGVGGQPACGPC